MHTNPHTGRPDHLCRSIFDKGIRCMPVSVTPAGEIVVVEGSEEPQAQVLTEAQVRAFCRPDDDDDDDHRKTPYVTGLEIDWNEDEATGKGSPQRVVFGCYGGEDKTRKFGMMDVGEILTTTSTSISPVQQVMKGAYPGAMLFLPQELGQSLAPTPLVDDSIDDTTTDTSSPFSIFQNKYDVSATQSCSTMILLVLLCIVYGVLVKSKTTTTQRCACCSKRQLSPLSAEDKRSLKNSFKTSYVELSSLDASSSSFSSSSYSTDSSSSSNHHKRFCPVLACSRDDYGLDLEEDDEENC